MSTQDKPSSWSVEDLIRLAKQHPPKPILKGLLYERDTLVLHGVEECFKSVFIVQMAESIATPYPLLAMWDVEKPRYVGVIETEMHPNQMGERLQGMFPDGHLPQNLCFLHENALRELRRQGMEEKFQTVEEWVRGEGIEVLVIDTANDFFRGPDDPSKETAVGGFFDLLRNLPLKARILVRHDRKPRENIDETSSNDKIRGSAEWKEDPEVILYLKRADKRTHEVRLEVGKLRYGLKPEPCDLWFDAGTFRLTPLPPVIAVLENGPRTRTEIGRVRTKIPHRARACGRQHKGSGAILESIPEGARKSVRN